MTPSIRMKWRRRPSSWRKRPTSTRRASKKRSSFPRQLSCGDKEEGEDEGGPTLFVCQGSVDALPRGTTGSTQVGFESRTPDRKRFSLRGSVSSRLPFALINDVHLPTFSFQRSSAKSWTCSLN